jgi:hypothetical protein
MGKSRLSGGFSLWAVFPISAFTHQGILAIVVVPALLPA